MKRRLIYLATVCVAPLLAMATDPAPTGPLYMIEVKVLSVAAGALGTNGLAITAESITVSTNGQWNAGGLLATLEASEGADVLSAPKLVTRAGQEAKIEIGRQVAYMVPETNVLYRVTHHWFSDDSVEAISNGLYRLQTLDEEKNPGISVALTVTPAGVGSVKADVNFRYNLLTEMTALPGTKIKMGSPVVESRKIHAAIVTKQGVWVALGGAQKVLNKAAVQDAHPTLPFLSSTKSAALEENIFVFLRVTEPDPAASASDALENGKRR